nr:putative ribonuclease H-like domain-containing protein [Tanacetum cinerariifolium]
MTSKDVKLVVAQLIPQLITMILNGSKKCDIKKPIWYLDSGCSRHMTGVKNYLYKYAKQPGPKVVFEDDSTCTTEGISQNFSSPYIPEQNSVAKRKNRTVIEAARTMLSEYVFSKQYWTEAVATACYTQNRSTIVKRHLKNPYEIFHNQISEHSSSPRIEDNSVHNTIPIPNSSLSITSMVTLAPQERWSQDKHIELVNIIGNPGAGGIRGDIGITTFKNTLRAHYLSHSSMYVPSPSIKIVRPWFATLGYSGEIRAKETLKKGFLPPRDRLKTAHTDSCSNEESRADGISKEIKLKDLSDLLKDTRSAFFTPDSPHDEPIIVLDKKFQALPSQVSSVQEKLKTLDSLPSQLNKVTDTLNRYATIVENASRAACNSAGKATVSPIEEEKNTNLTTRDVEQTNLHNELVDLLGMDIVTQYYNEKLLYDKYCDKMLKRRKSSKIINCDVLTQKGPYHTATIHDRWDS